MCFARTANLFDSSFLNRNSHEKIVGLRVNFVRLTRLQFDWDKVSPTFPALQIERLSLVPMCDILTTR